MVRSVGVVVAFVIGSAYLRADVVYVSSLGNHEVLRDDATTGAFIDTFIVAASGGLNQPHGILERCDDIIVASFGNDRVLRYDRDTGAFLDIFIDATSGLDNPVCMLYGPDGSLYISSQGSDEILRYTTAGVFIDEFVSASSGGLDGPSGFAFGPDGRLYVAGRFSANVLAYNGASGAFDEVIADSSDGLTSGNTFGLAFGDNDDLYFVSNGQVFRYDLGTSSILTKIPLAGPIGLERGPSGDIVAATANNLRIIDTTTNAVSSPFLSGGVINTLNFFRFPSASPAPGCAEIPAASGWSLAALVILLAIGGSLRCPQVDRCNSVRP